jgi:hypothetical protein
VLNRGSKLTEDLLRQAGPRHAHEASIYAAVCCLNKSSSRNVSRIWSQLGMVRDVYLLPAICDSLSQANAFRPAHRFLHMACVTPIINNGASRDIVGPYDVTEFCGGLVGSPYKRGC